MTLTSARLQTKSQKGYDKFPITSIVHFDTHLINFCHMETVVLLRRENIDGYIDIDLDVEKLEGKSGIATYKEIKAYIEEKYGMSVPSGYIAQVKDKVGLEKRKNYNVGSGKGRVANCPPEKEDVIMDAFRHFNLI